MKLKRVECYCVVPFLCAFMNIITLKASFQENRVLGYEYANEKARKEWWSAYEDRDLLWNLEYWSERYVKEYGTLNMSNSRPQYMKKIVPACTFISLL